MSTLLERMSTLLERRSTLLERLRVIRERSLTNTGLSLTTPPSVSAYKQRARLNTSIETSLAHTERPLTYTLPLCDPQMRRNPAIQIQTPFFFTLPSEG